MTSQYMNPESKLGFFSQFEEPGALQLPTFVQQYFPVGLQSEDRHSIESVHPAPSAFFAAHFPVLWSQYAPSEQ